ncbi:hypothetical protein VCHC46A1_0715 [Vibrio cholerae HC-46A1]|nr:hypothetical protein VCE_001467 [Vibrio cholerae B33]EEO21346.1 hypothetical protein VCF_001291 [Vibrio cholerae BX 330286]EGR01104.1 hypothetical protein VCHCUF01_2228 [Vibrio cholerae HCUF01]EJH58707.1 hypothetical protein VCHC46A1_0715 [Vibrio cholerae HC-46A1]EMQ00775.1 hypothetical protein VCAG7404_003310 [Vibrio cholerae O1 str. AG-7404]
MALFVYRVPGRHWRKAESKQGLNKAESTQRASINSKQEGVNQWRGV